MVGQVERLPTPGARLPNNRAPYASIYGTGGISVSTRGQAQRYCRWAMLLVTTRTWVVTNQLHTMFPFPAQVGKDCCVQPLSLQVDLTSLFGEL